MLHKSFKKAIRSALLVSVSVLGVATSASAQDRFDSYNDLNDSYGLTTQFQDVCVPNAPSTLNSNAILREQQNIAREALDDLRTSAIANTFLNEQGDAMCLSTYDVPVQVDRHGFIQNTSNQARDTNKARTVMAMADRLVNTDLTMRGYSYSGERPQNVEEHFRRAVHLVFMAEIFKEMKDNGERAPYNLAAQSHYKTVFSNFAAHSQDDIDTGVAHMNAIKTYFKDYYRTAPRQWNNHGYGHHSPYHPNSDNGAIFADNSDRQPVSMDLYGMGNRPNKSNIFEASMSRNGFNLQYFLQSARHGHQFGHNRP